MQNLNQKLARTATQSHMGANAKIYNNLFFKSLWVMVIAIPFASLTSLAANSETKASEGKSSPNTTNQSTEGIADRENLPIVWVNLAKGELKVFGRLVGGKRATVFTTKVSIGKNGPGKTKSGDKKTPVGIYKITKFITRNELPKRYGNGAFTLNYPNQYDKILDRTGDGIWIHGRPSEKEDAPYLDTKGCIAMDNESLDALGDYIRSRETTVVISNSFDYANYEKEALVKRIQKWSDAWVSLDHESYIDFYDKSFSNGLRNYSEWDHYKSRINAAKSSIDIQLSDFEILEYPEEEDLVWVSFYQDYKSSNYNWEGRKIMLWKKDSRNRWKIVFEGDE